jgi:hypothetical protein
MKYIFLAFFVLLAAQPVQASPCDMQSPQETVHGDSHDMNHDDSMDMDCCDPDSPDSSENCDHQCCGIQFLHHQYRSSRRHPSAADRRRWTTEQVQSTAAKTSYLLNTRLSRLRISSSFY